MLDGAAGCDGAAAERPSLDCRVWAKTTVVAKKQIAAITENALATKIRRREFMIGTSGNGLDFLPLWRFRTNTGDSRLL
jgi:hypothetical protein